MLDLNSPAVETKATVRCGSVPHVGQSSVFLLELLNQFSLLVVSYSILLFRGTPQQLGELFVAVHVGKPGLEMLLSLWIWDEPHTALLGSTPTAVLDKSSDLFVGFGFC